MSYVDKNFHRNSLTFVYICDYNNYEILYQPLPLSYKNRCMVLQKIQFEIKHQSISIFKKLLNFEQNFIKSQNKQNYIVNKIYHGSYR